MSWLAVGIGAVLGAWLRWLATILLGAYQNQLPLGTLVVNLAGGYMAGLAVGFFEAHPLLPVEWRLLVITGFLGGLTTFSTFSAESMVLLQQGDYAWFLGHALLHLFGSIILCIAGFATYRAITF
ncbi:crcB-like family protein [Collimonas arenae]|uniref:Fluoride-specific ion channel FluC n=1 Tax=Collimonas arenae TaxID=279058 RepID=A0A127QIJ0_9BURK|nr:fluoride efflux transporter CrcB [Collimonas arenae]AMO99959.1 crcB-like family protein [Collimonas arenae]AMP09853.1 crcB-like family protein [Collimonas arenae]